MATHMITPRSPRLRTPVPLVLARILAAIVVCAVLPGLAVAQVLPSVSPETVGMSTPRLQLLGDAMQREIADGRLPGVVVAVARRGKLPHNEAFGCLRPGGPPMPKNAIFQIASMTKPLTTVAALMLQEEGRLLLNDLVDAYLPEWADLSVDVMSDGGQRVVRTEPPRRRVTLADLLQHTAGIRNGFIGSTELHLRYREG